MQDQDTGARNFQAVLTQLKLRHLRVIDALMEAKSVSGAAKILHITQPAVSKALREIEDILGAALFRRGPQGLSLTDYGRIVLMHGRQMQTQLQRMVEEIEAIRAGDSGVVTIGALDGQPAGSGASRTAHPARAQFGSSGPHHS